MAREGTMTAARNPCLVLLALLFCGAMTSEAHVIAVKAILEPLSDTKASKALTSPTGSASRAELVVLGNTHTGVLEISLNATSLSNVTALAIREGPAPTAAVVNGSETVIDLTPGVSLSGLGGKASSVVGTLNVTGDDWLHLVNEPGGHHASLDVNGVEESLVGRILVLLEAEPGALFSELTAVGGSTEGSDGLALVEFRDNTNGTTTVSFRVTAYDLENVTYVGLESKSDGAVVFDFSKEGADVASLSEVASVNGRFLKPTDTLVDVRSNPGNYTLIVKTAKNPKGALSSGPLAIPLAAVPAPSPAPSSGGAFGRTLSSSGAFLLAVAGTLMLLA